MSSSAIPDRPLAVAIRQLATEAGAWYLPALLFLAAYVLYFSAPSSAVTPHLIAVTWVISLVLASRLLLAMFLGPRAALAGAVLVYSLAIAAMAAYYLLVAVGLRSWGRVITLELLTSYFAQLPDLVAALDVHWAGAALAAFAAAAVLVTVMALLARRATWPAALAARLRRPLPVVLLLAVMLLAGKSLSDYLRFAGTASKEPLAMTFSVERLSGDPRRDRPADPALDGREEQARASYAPATAPARRNVIIIIVDALRPDHMGVHGYARDTTPFLSGRQREGRLRISRHMRATCAESACGLLSIFASRFVHEAPGNAFTLHQVLKRHGYAVHLILGGDHTNFYRLGAAYGEVDSFFDGSLATGYYMNDDRYVIDRTHALPAPVGRPVFLQYHLMSAHQLSKRDPARSPFQPSSNYAAATGGPRPQHTNFYDNGVRHADQVIGELLGVLEAKGYLEDAVVVITADHGEGLGEHGLYSHGKGVGEPMIRVPFMMLGTAGLPALADRPDASQVDIAPTILHELGMPIPSTWTGRPLQHPAEPREIWFEQPPDYGVLAPPADGHAYKYVFRRTTAEEFVYDLAADPAESRNLAAAAPAVRDRLRQRVPAARRQAAP